MLSDLIGIEKLGDTYTYRIKHNFRPVAPAIRWFMLVSGVFIARLDASAPCSRSSSLVFALYAGCLL